MLEIDEGERRHDQADRARDRRPRLGRGLDRAASRRRTRTGQDGRGRRLRAGRARGCAAAEPRRPRGHRVRARRGRAAGSLRFGVPDFKIEKRLVERRVAAARRRGRRVPLRRRRRRRRRRDELRERFDAVVVCDGLARAARPAGAGPRARRRPLRDGLPLPAQPLRRAAQPAPRRADLGRRAST